MAIRAVVLLCLAACGVWAGTSISKLPAIQNPRRVPGFLHPTHGYLQVALCGQKSTTLRVMAPPGWKCPPHNHTGTPYEVVTIVTRGTLTLVQRLPSGLLRRRDFPPGSAFIWPMGPDDYYGFENRTRQAVEFYMVYMPAFPKVRSPLDGLKWLQAGCPRTGPPPGFKAKVDPYPRW